MYCAYYGREISSGFLIVLRFDALYQAYVARYASSRDWYAIPRVDRSWHDTRVRYRGLDRDALQANEVRPENLTEIFLAELERKGRCASDFLFTLDDVTAAVSWLEEDARRYEVIWARELGRPDLPPVGYERLGVEPGYFLTDHFSPSCDCMMFPRWHGTDPDGVLFVEHFRRLNQNGLFDSVEDAERFVEFYVSFDWTETAPCDGYAIVEVFSEG